MITATDKENISRFLGYARQGKHPGASGGEKRCYRLARHLREMIEDTPGVDAGAIAGCSRILELSATGYGAAKELLETAVGKEVRR